MWIREVPHTVATCQSFLLCSHFQLLSCVVCAIRYQTSIPIGKGLYLEAGPTRTGTLLKSRWYDRVSFLLVFCSVVDPYRYVFGPPRSGSVSQRRIRICTKMSRIHNTGFLVLINSEIDIIDFRMIFLHTRNVVDIRFKSFGDNTWSKVLKLRFPCIYLPLLPLLL